LPTQAPGTAESLETRLRLQFAQRSDYLAFPHRLDRPVGGLILVALTKKAARLLTEQFMARKVHKDYLAIVAGRVERESSVWIDYLRKIPDQARAEVVPSNLQTNSPSELDEQAKLAETAIEIIRYDERSDRTLLRLSPVTGRMHQLRVQAASRGFPIIGDILYGGPALQGGAERILLQAHQLRFFDPRDSRPVTVTASDTWTESV
jgi:23S rRNA-/tRNA-specific pseudouridylate synthase